MKSLQSIFFKRPRILNVLHGLRLTSAATQTTPEELNALARYAEGSKVALEIGTYQGVSAAAIAGPLAPDGILYCIDPWPEPNGKRNPCWLICKRHLKRTGMLPRIRILRGLSQDVQSAIPNEVDFAFIDGDHSHAGLETDWSIVSRRLRHGGIACLHDTVIPSQELWRNFGSVEFYNDVISNDLRFELLETVYSMAVLRKR